MRKGLRQASRLPKIDRAFEEEGTNLPNLSSSRESFLVKVIKGTGKEAGPSAAPGVGLFTSCRSYQPPHSLPFPSPADLLSSAIDFEEFWSLR